MAKIGVKLLNLVLGSILIAGVTTGVLTNTLVANACSPPNPGATGSSWQAGGYQNFGVQSPLTGGAHATIASYNPSPVPYDSSIWLALQNNNIHSIAQIGWLHAGPLNRLGVPSHTNEYVFLQWTDDYGYYSNVVEANIPAPSEDYYVYWDGGNTPFDLEWNEGFYLAQGQGVGTPNWYPNSVDVYGELHDYTPQGNSSTAGIGSHAAGDGTTPDVVSNVSYWSHTALLTYDAHDDIGGSTQYQKLYSFSGNSFEEWDGRCNS